MLTNFEQFAVTSMMGSGDTPPRANGGLCFSEEWERTVFGTALALARDGHFEWEEFRQELIASIDGWEKTHALDEGSWDYYERWMAAFEKLVLERGLISRDELEDKTAALGGERTHA